MGVTTLWQSNSWGFDPRSALFGAIIAWAIALLLYRQRVALKYQQDQLRSRFNRWRTRSQRSTSEKYLGALKTALRQLLLLNPQNPFEIFIPPTFLAPAPLPANPAEVGFERKPLVIKYDALLQGHNRLVVCGPPGSGRTTALAMTLWFNERNTAPQTGITLRLPVWVDLASSREPLAPGASAVQIIAEWATRFMPQALPKWLVHQLKSQQSVILVDNWDALLPEERRVTAQVLAQAAAELPNSVWLVASGIEGYGPLVEVDFTPVEIQPGLDRDTPAKLHKGWSTLLGHGLENMPAEALSIMRWAVEAGDSLAEQTLRVNLQLRCEETPYRPAEVMESLLRHVFLPMPGLEEYPEKVTEAQEMGMDILAQLARIHRLEGRSASPTELQEITNRRIPVVDKQDPTPGMIRKAIQNTALLDRTSRNLRFVHPLWEDFLAARALATESQETHLEPLLLLEHLFDRDWWQLLDFYAGINDAEPLVKALLRYALPRAAQPDARDEQEALLLAARWTIRAPESVAWRTYVAKALAQEFVQPNTERGYRLKVVKALALVAGEQACPIFKHALRHSELAVRIAAIRGIGWTGTSGDLKLLIAALNDSNSDVQESALRAISDLGVADAYHLLAEILPQVSERSMLLITQLLGTNPDGWERLREAAQADDLLVRRAAAHGLAFVQDTWALELLQQMVRHDPQWLVRSAAEAALSERQPSLHVLEAPPKPDTIQWLLAWAAKQGLGVGVGEAAMNLLLHALQTGDSITRVMAARTLSQIGHPDHLAALRALHDNPEPELQSAARLAVHQIEARYRGLVHLVEAGTPAS